MRIIETKKSKEELINLISENLDSPKLRFVRSFNELFMGKWPDNNLEFEGKVNGEIFWMREIQRMKFRPSPILIGKISSGQEANNAQINYQFKPDNEQLLTSFIPLVILWIVGIYLNFLILGLILITIIALIISAVSILVSLKTVTKKYNEYLNNVLQHRAKCHVG